MGIGILMPQYNMAYSTSQLQQQVSLSVTKKAMDSAEVQAQNLIRGMLQGVPTNGTGNLVNILA